MNSISSFHLSEKHCRHCHYFFKFFHSNNYFNDKKKLLLDLPSKEVDFTRFPISPLVVFTKSPVMFWPLPQSSGVQLSAISQLLNVPLQQSILPVVRLNTLQLEAIKPAVKITTGGRWKPTKNKKHRRDTFRQIYEKKGDIVCAAVCLVELCSWNIFCWYFVLVRFVCLRPILLRRIHTEKSLR